MNRKNSRKSRTLQIESLESRQLMAADIDFQDGVVEIDGTNRADQVEVSYAGSKYIRVTVNGETDKFRRSKVDEIRFVGHSGNDTFKNRTSIDSVVDGGGGNDRLIGGSGDDRLDGGSGNDTIYGKAGRDRIKGGSGNDRLFGGSGRDTLDGNKGADYLSGGGSADVLKGRGGNDTLHGGGGRDTLYGGSGDDRLYGGDGQDELHGEDGNDRLEGGHDNDSLKGGDGHDTLKGEHGSDHLMGGNGNDKLYGGTGKDELEGGKGRDHLNGGDGDDILKGRSGRDSLYGGNGHDELWGGSGDDYLNGGDGQDELHGGKDNDVLFGGLDGGVRDELRGDEGDDAFLWRQNDQITHIQRNDARIELIDSGEMSYKGNEVGAGSWTGHEVELVHEAVDTLMQAIGNAKLLQREGSNTMKLFRHGTPPTQTNLGWNTNTGEIHIHDSTFASDDLALQTVYHEFAHNLDDENPHWNEFLELSGWTQAEDGWSYESNADDTFARAYGKTSPHEDYATAFAKHFMEKTDRTYDGTSGDEFAEKAEFIEDNLENLA